MGISRNVFYEYLQRIFDDAILGDDLIIKEHPLLQPEKYESIGEYKVKDYVERPHEYVKDK